MREACHDIMYTVVNSRAYAPENLRTGLETWMKVAIGIDVVIGVLLIGWETLAIRTYLRKRHEAKITIA